MEYDFSHWKQLPRISCWCPTFAREELLEEAIQSFLIQDYPGEKELVILNDYEEQELVFKHPEVKIYNIQWRIPHLSKKTYEVIGLCNYEYLASWASDDISFKSRLSRSVERMHKGGPLLHLPDDRKNFQFYAPGGWFISHIDENNEYSTKYVKSFDFGACLFSKEAFAEGEHYNLEKQACLGPSIQEKFQIFGYWSVDMDLPHDQTFYLYRRFLKHDKWLPHVLAARAEGGNGSDLTKAQEHYAKHSRKGRIELNPHWKMDYENGQ